jgi:4,5-DOPA dioxygenase extradiol
VPVLQLSLDIRCAPAQHYEIGRKLAALRDDGVLLLGSGNIVHNLRQFRRDGAPPADWALRFNDWAKARMAARDHAALVDYESLGADARLAVPESEHFLPLLYVLATQTEAEPATFFADAVTSSISMTSVGVGLPN